MGFWWINLPGAVIVIVMNQTENGQTKIEVKFENEPAYYCDRL